VEDGQGEYPVISNRSSNINYIYFKSKDRNTTLVKLNISFLSTKCASKNACRKLTLMWGVGKNEQLQYSRATFVVIPVHLQVRLDRPVQSFETNPLNVNFLTFCHYLINKLI
jgi:hypothetical protein